MADEATVRCSLYIDKRSSDNTIQRISHNKSREFRVDVSGAKGPTPGAFTASVGGIVLDFSQLTQPGLCTVENNDSSESNYIELCIYDPTTDRAYPFAEIGPGEMYVLKLSRNFLEEYGSTGTGTTGPSNQLLARCYSGTANGSFQCFEA